MPTWTICERHGGVAEASQVTPGLCAQCAPSPEAAEALAHSAAQRLRAAKAAARASGPAPEWSVVAPDIDHVWIRSTANARWTRAHLFEVGTTSSYCAKVAVFEPVGRGRYSPAPDGSPPCRACWRSFHSDRSCGRR